MKDPRSSRDIPPSALPTGARHDDSSLFSLDALKRTEEEARKQKDRDDSGLIDLKALAAIEHEPRPRSEMAVATVVAPPDLFQLSTPIVPIAAAPVSVEPPAFARPANPARTRLLIAAGAVVAVLAAVGVFVATRGGPEAPPVAVAIAGAAPAPSPTVPPPAAAPPPEEPKPAAVTPGMRPTADPPPPPAAAPAPAAPPKPAPQVAAAPRSSPAPRAAPKADAPPAKPANACDLTCQMQRAVSGKR